MTFTKGPPFLLLYSYLILKHLRGQFSSHHLFLSTRIFLDLLLQHSPETALVKISSDLPIAKSNCFQSSPFLVFYSMCQCCLFHCFPEHCLLLFLYDFSYHSLVSLQFSSPAHLSRDPDLQAHLYISQVLPTHHDQNLC